jgi:oligoribonuclease NrnB/cAMP/cGMP phosphodiesterase (DHH superfamily)
MTQSKIKLVDFVGDKLEEDFLEFDLTEIQLVLQKLEVADPIDLAHAEQLQQLSLRGADILTDYLGKIVKTVAYLETKVNSTKNKVALNYQEPNGNKTTSDMKKWYSESAPEVEELQIRLAKAKASKVVLEKKYDILIKSHHHYKDISSGIRKTILGFIPKSSEKVPEGYE